MWLFYEDMKVRRGLFSPTNGLWYRDEPAKSATTSHKQKQFWDAATAGSSPRYRASSNRCRTTTRIAASSSRYCKRWRGAEAVAGCRWHVARELARPDGSSESRDERHGADHFRGWLGEFVTAISTLLNMERSWLVRGTEWRRLRCTPMAKLATRNPKDANPRRRITIPL